MNKFQFNQKSPSLATITVVSICNNVNEVEIIEQVKAKMVVNMNSSKQQPTNDDTHHYHDIDCTRTALTLDHSQIFTMTFDGITCFNLHGLVITV